ncbi:transmembrane channel-like protein 1 isoform X2 [Halichondria panicea]|uniref:transmembrane channel-like protein 1 isoform X2 n=1 Tax=Halichondria panicea TaxID=6063 RepID=UPI00312BA0FD
MDEDKEEIPRISVESIEVNEEEVVGRDERVGLRLRQDIDSIYGLDEEEATISVDEVNEEEVVIGRDERVGLDEGEVSISVESIEVKEVEEVVETHERVGPNEGDIVTISVESIEVNNEEMGGRDERFGLDEGEVTISMESTEVKQKEVVGRDERVGLDEEEVTISMVSIEVKEKEVVVGRDERVGLDEGETPVSVESMEVKEKEVVVGRDERVGLDKEVTISMESIEEKEGVVECDERVGLDEGETLVIGVESIEGNEEEVVGRDKRFGSAGGLSEKDSLSRRRQEENSSLSGAVSHTVSVAAQPIEPKVSSSHELHHFIQEQRKIITTFRAQPWPMQVKLAALRSCKENLHKHAHNLNTIDTFRDSSGLALTKAKRLFNTITETFTVWNTTIKNIEGNFGTTVASFFDFLRWMCALNLVLTVFVVCFIVLPQLLVGHGLDVPDSIRGNTSAISIVIDGRGYAFEYSVLFYGYYDSGQNESYTAPPANKEPYLQFGVIQYKLPLAYLLVLVGIFVISGAAILKSMAKKLKSIKVANAGEHFLFSWKVFASWDFAITSSNLAAGMRKKIGISLKETIAEAKKQEQTGKKTVWRWVIRGFTNFFLLAALAASSYAIVLVVENAKTVDQNTDILAAVGQGWEGLYRLILAFQVQLVIVARNFIIPLLFRMAGLVEGFHPRGALKMMLLRMFVLYFSSLYVLVVALFTLSSTCEATSHCCWETIIGQELYKLTIINLLTDLGFVILLDGARWILSTRLFLPCTNLNKLYNEWIGRGEFQVAGNVLNLVYGQALIMFGVLFCPILVGIGFAKNVVTFYAKVGAVNFFNKPADTLFRIASTRNFYMGLLLLTVFTVALPVIYVAVELVPSNNCGPFRGLPNMLHIVVDEIATWPSIVQTVIGYCQRPTVLIPLIALLCIVIYYFAGQSFALKKANKELRLQLRVEQNDAREKLRVYALGDTTKKKAVQSMKENLHKAAILNNKLENQTEENSIINSKQYQGARAELPSLESHADQKVKIRRGKR